MLERLKWRTILFQITTTNDTGLSLAFSLPNKLKMALLLAAKIMAHRLRHFGTGILGHLALIWAIQIDIVEFVAQRVKTGIINNCILSLITILFLVHL